MQAVHFADPNCGLLHFEVNFLFVGVLQHKFLVRKRVQVEYFAFLARFVQDFHEVRVNAHAIRVKDLVGSWRVAVQAQRLLLLLRKGLSLLRRRLRDGAGRVFVQF